MMRAEFIILLLVLVLRSECLRVAPVADDDLEEDDGSPLEELEIKISTTIKPTPKTAAVLQTRKILPDVGSSINMGKFGNNGNAMKTKDVKMVIEITPGRKAVTDIFKILKNTTTASEKHSGKILEDTPFTSSRTTATSLNLTRSPTGDYYFQTKIRLNWFAAGDWCRRQGMDLATITTQEENTYIVDKLMSIFAEAKESKNSNAFFWMGLNSLATEKSFTWVATGDELGSFRFWSPKQPDFGSELCGEYMYRDADKPMWNDRTCATPGRFICETRTEPLCKSSAK